MDIILKLRVLCSFLKYTLMLILFALSVFVSKNVLEQYDAKATSFKQHEEYITEKDSATVVVNLWPLKKTNYSTSVPHQSYEQWKFGKDFSITFGVTNYRTSQERVIFQEKSQEMNILHSFVGKVKFSELIGRWGYFYKLSTSFDKVRYPFWLYVQVNFSQEIADEEIPSVHIYLSSEENSYGKTMHDWQDGKRIRLIGVQGFLWIEFQLKKLEKMKLESKCSEHGYYDCLHKNLIKHDFHQCPRKCFSISTIGKAKPICTALDEFQCSHNITETLKARSNCKPACNQIDYALESEYQEDLDVPDAKRNVTFAYRVFEPILKVEEEYLIQDFVGMLGSIGGTLGLFIGFSFSGGISFFLHHIQEMMEKVLSKGEEKVNDQEQSIVRVAPKSQLDNLESTLIDILKKVDNVEAKINLLTTTHTKSEEKLSELEKQMGKVTKIVGIVKTRKI